MPQVGTSHLHGHDLQRAARNKLATYSLRFTAQSSGDADGKNSCLATGQTYSVSAPSFIRKKVMTMNEEWSNDACRVAMLSKPWKTVGSMQRTFIRCSLSFMKSLISALLRRRRTTTKIGNTDLGPSWPEAWRRTKGQHALPGAVLSLFPTGTMREMLAVNQLRKGGFNGTIRYLSE